METSFEDEKTYGVTQVHLDALIELSHKAHSLSLRRNRIRARKADAHRSPFKGRGMEYNESRLYTAGDDTRHLDWRLMARTGEAYTKLFCEEHERPVYFGVDYTTSMFFATQQAFKSVMATQISALLAWSAIHEGDRVGGVLFTDKHHTEIKPQRDKKGILQWLHQLAHFSIQEAEHDVRAGAHAGRDAFLRLAHLVRPGSLVFLVSDFRDIRNHEETLRALASHSEVVLVHVYDPLEQVLPPPGEYPVSNGEDSFYINSADRTYAAEYARRFDQRVDYLKSLVRRLRTSFVQCGTQQDAFQILQLYFGVR